ncbi:hypothetical protein [Thalassovita sp.]|uniref:hypothetical protein n=1 Tax=Thalassovita sp. TaxID=1979401 RepID=UPI0029DE6CD2|nr:hypothetical protein [Thalassovita sp.]
MWWLIPLMFLVACGGPSPEFRGVQPTRVKLAGSVFDVRVKGDRAEAIRRNAEYAPRMGPIGVKAGLAIEEVSGCRVRKLTGDQAMIRARLDCGKKHSRYPSTTTFDLDCEIEIYPTGPYSGDAELACRPASG